MKPLFFCTLLSTTAVTFGQAQLGPQRLEIAIPAEALETIREARQLEAEGDPAKENAAKKESAAKTDPEKFRKDFLAKLTFDRTPAAILKAETESRKKKTPTELAAQSESQANSLQNTYQQEAENYRQNVSLGHWEEVRAYLADLPPELATTSYSKLLTDLGQPVQVKPRPQLAAMGAKPHRQSHFLTVVDVLALSNASPTPLETSQIASLAKLLPPNPAPEFFTTLANGTRYFGKATLEQKVRTSALLLDSNHVEAAADFLPALATAREEGSQLALNVLSRFHTEAYQADLGKEHLPLAWELSLEVVSDSQAPTEIRGEALNRALTLVEELEEGAGEEWLKATFSDPSGEGFDILAAVGMMGVEASRVRDADFRLRRVKLQSSAAEALLATEGIDLSEWKEIFTLYALNWLTEAELSERLDRSTSLRPQAQFDSYGNRFFSSRTRTQSSDRDSPNPIPVGDLLDRLPSQSWISAVDNTVRLQLLERIPTLFLKVKEHQKAFPFIRAVAAERPETAQNLVRNLINVWAENHNPNQENRYRSSYSYYYGYNNRAQTIPLTRSKQERNLQELAELVTEVHALGLEDSFDEEFSSAFITVHSQAEVWRLQALEKVFGDLEKLDPDTIASLIERMRINLAALWPNPKVQEEAKTKRSDVELHEQVMDGYAMARELTSRARDGAPDSSRLLTQLAALTYEESNYLSAKQPQTSHSTTKRAALDDLAKAAQLYATSLPREDSSEESTAVYETWFFAALGSPLLEVLKSHHQPVQSEFAKIKAALASLPEGARERHQTRFARTINSRLTNVAPDLKFRYLESALSITGAHEEMETSAEVYDYYQDLVTEIELLASVDGNDRIGREPFGLFVNLHHTKEIERESGGFQRYLQNQNTSNSYSYNFGRPTEDYRDKFEKSARAALAENFDILSLTFHSSKIESRTSRRLGWRTTPYAYFLLQAKGPQIDSIPPLKIDLDFLDTSGHVVLPISSANLPVDASAEAESRPFRNLKLTMTLDERSAEESEEWHLEVKATGEGLVPPLTQLVNLPPPGFEVTKTEDRNLQIQELTSQTRDGAPLSSHEYRLTLKPQSSPTEFTFPALTALATQGLTESEGVLRQRYVDVDLLPVGETVALEISPQSRAWIWGLLLIVLIATTSAWLWFRGRRGYIAAPASESGPTPPQQLTAVSLLHWLKQLEGKVSDEKKPKLKAEIDALEQKAFGKGNAHLELDKIAQAWSS